MAKRLLLSLIAVGCIINLNAQAPIQPIYGLGFSPYENGQDPNLGTQLSADQIQSRMQIVAPYTNRIRGFSMTHGLENIPPIARSLHLAVAANAWLSSDLAQNTLEINNLIAAAVAGNVDIAIVGSEVLLRQDLTEAQLIAYMNQVRAAIPSNIPVTTADTYGTLLAHLNVIAASDVVFGNFYPYWEGVSIDNAICHLDQNYKSLVPESGAIHVRNVVQQAD